MKKVKKGLIIFALFGCMLLSGCTSIKSGFEKIGNTFEVAVNGIDRRAHVYANDGTLLRSYYGDINIRNYGEDGIIIFDVDGKEYVVYGGIVVVEESRSFEE